MTPHCALQKSLGRRAERDCLRALRLTDASHDFYSNDYLGFSTLGLISSGLQKATKGEDPLFFGATGSRLLSGNFLDTMKLEEAIASHHGSEAALLYQSGYAANLGLLSSLPRDDIELIYDQDVHASMKDGIVLSRAVSRPFYHNDLDHLEKRLKTSKKEAYVCIEALYSMDGTLAPLKETASLCRRYHAHLIVDEAHSVGIYGNFGQGLVSLLGLEQDTFARTISYGKAFGCHGGAILGDRFLKDYLLQFSRSFIYSTALPTHSINALRVSYDLISDHQNRLNLEQRISAFSSDDRFSSLSSPILCVPVPLEKIAPIESKLLSNGFNVRAIKSPSVRSGFECLRICIHSFNDLDAISRLKSKLGELL